MSSAGATNTKAKSQVRGWLRLRYFCVLRYLLQVSPTALNVCDGPLISTLFFSIEYRTLYCCGRCTFELETAMHREDMSGTVHRKRRRSINTCENTSCQYNATSNNCHHDGKIIRYNYNASSRKLPIFLLCIVSICIRHTVALINVRELTTVPRRLCNLQTYHHRVHRVSCATSSQLYISQSYIESLSAATAIAFPTFIGMKSDKLRNGVVSTMII